MFSDVGIKAIFSGIVFVLIFITGKCFCSKEYWKYSIAFNLPVDSALSVKLKIEPVGS